MHKEVDEFGIPYRYTGIPCFECGKRSGIDCPGREPNEATRCVRCLKLFLEKERRLQLRQHFKDLKNGKRRVE